MMRPDPLLAQLQRHEGFRALPYRCTRDSRTVVGYGHPLDESPLVVPEDGLTQAQALQVLADDIHRARLACQLGIPAFEALSEPRQAVLINLCHGMGWARLVRLQGLLGELGRALHARGYYADVATQIEASDWAHQAKGRARELAEQMRTGRWADDGRCG